MGDLLLDPALTSGSQEPVDPSSEPVLALDDDQTLPAPPEVALDDDDDAPDPILVARLNDALALVWAELAARASEASFLELLAEVFGASAEAASQLAALLAGGDTLGLRYELETDAEMAGAAGAYAVVGDNGVATIYINGDWLASASDDELRLVLLEEIGHSFDTELNGDGDTAGDEGELFAALFSGEALSTEQRAAIAAEDDSATLTIDGVQVGVELDQSTGVRNMTYSVDPITGDLTVTGILDFNDTNSNPPTLNVSIVRSGVVNINPAINTIETYGYGNSWDDANSGTSTTFTAVFSAASLASYANTSLLIKYDVLSGTDSSVAYTYNFGTPSGNTFGSVTEKGGAGNGTQPVGTSDTATGDLDPPNNWSLTTGANFGTAAINSTTGVWTYVLENANSTVEALAQGVTTTDTFVVQRNSATTVVTITITGTNDNAIINVGPTPDTSVTEAGGANNAIAGDSNASGSLSITDVDAGQAFFQVPGTLTQTYGSFTFTSTGAWTYTLDNTDSETQALNAGVTATDSLLVTSLDGTASQTITVTITGGNDNAIINGTKTGGVTEDLAVSGGSLTATGVFTVTDVDSGEAVFNTTPAAVGTPLGNLAITSGGSWTYKVNNNLTAVQELGAGETKIDQFVVTSFDGTASETVTITITGVNDAPNLDPILPGNLSPQFSDTLNSSSGGIWTFRAIDPDLSTASLSATLTISRSGFSRTATRTTNDGTGTNDQVSVAPDAGWITGDNLKFGYVGKTQVHGKSYDTWQLTGLADLNSYAGTDFGGILPYTINFSVTDGLATSTATAALNVQKEDATVTYTGQTAFYTSSNRSSTAQVLLEGLLVDADDGSRGNITSAKAMFSWAGGGTGSSPWQNVSSLDAGKLTGYSSFLASLSAGTDGCKTYKVKISAGGNYTGSGEDDVLVSVIQAGGTGFLGGGGVIGSRGPRDPVTGAYTAMGMYGGSLGEDAIGFINFGFNTKYNKTGKNLLGNTTILIRGYFDTDEDLDTYLIKSNATDMLTGSSGKYTFTARANIFDTDNSDAQIAEQANLRVVGFDAARTASPTDVDTFAFSLSDKDGGLLFNTGFQPGTTTFIDHILVGGNIHAG